MAVPCGMSKGLPVSMQLISKHYDEATIYRAAHAFEKGAKWKTM
jgi:amidase